MRCLFDSYAWAAYLEGGISGSKVNEIIKGENEVYALTMNLVEVISKVARRRGNTDMAYIAMTSNAKFIEPSLELIKEAGLFHARMREKIPTFSFVDALLCVVAKDSGLKIVTGDNHFKGFKNVIFI